MDGWMGGWDGMERAAGESWWGELEGRAGGGWEGRGCVGMRERGGGSFDLLCVCMFRWGWVGGMGRWGWVGGIVLGGGDVLGGGFGVFG